MYPAGALAFLIEWPVASVTGGGIIKRMIQSLNELKQSEQPLSVTAIFTPWYPNQLKLFGKRNVKTCILVTGAGHKGIIPTNRSFFFAFGWVSNPGVAAVSPAWSLRSSDTLISWNWDMAVIPHPACCPNCCNVHLDNEKGFLPVCTCSPLILRGCCDFVPPGLLTGVVHDVQVVGQLGAGQVVLVRIT